VIAAGNWWTYVQLVSPLPPGHHVVEVIVREVPVIFGDVFFVGIPILFR